MKMIVGLGNPGKEYENTRHNIGFRTIDLFAKNNKVEFNKNKFNGIYADFNYQGEKIILLKPQSFINLSGEVVRKYMDFFKISIEDLLIINDDLDLPLGKFKLKSSGSSGGHNGLKNIELHLGTSNYKRLKVGISNDKMIDTKDYVLGRLSVEENKVIDEEQVVLQDILNDFLILNFDILMNKYNSRK